VSDFNAWIHGQRAAYAGRPGTDNPHPSTDRKHTHWTNGWNTASEKLATERKAREGEGAT
jgi:hypothetical protein